MKKKKIEHVEGIATKEPKRKKDKNFPFDFKNLYEDLQGYREDDWRKIVLSFEANPHSTYNAWRYIAYHPMFYYFLGWNDEKVPLVHERHLVSEDGWARVHIDPVMINPADNRISDDPHMNTKIQWWVEYGPTLFRDNIPGHDWKRDFGADTYDEAIVKVAKSVHKHYGNDRRQVIKKWNDIPLPKEN